MSDLQRCSWHLDKSCCYNFRNHYHISGDISFAARQFVSMTRDKLWLQEDGGCSLIRDIAHFWYTLAKWNTKTRRYDILGMLSVWELLATSNGVNWLLKIYVYHVCHIKALVMLFVWFLWEWTKLGYLWLFFNCFEQFQLASMLKAFISRHSLRMFFSFLVLIGWYGFPSSTFYMGESVIKLFWPTFLT